MGLYDDVVEVPRRTMVLFFLVDTSGSMYGSKIGTVNSAIEEVVPELKDISESNADAQIKIATLAFSTGSQWITSEPVPAETFIWNYLDANGVTDLGDACCQLNEKLSRNGFMGDVTGSFAPAIFLLSDGEPTDNYQHGLDKLKQNNWFKKAIKVAIAIGNDANQQKLAEFTGNVESVITVHTPDALKKWIRFVSVRASEIGSKSANAGSSSNVNSIGGSGDSDDGSGVVSKQDEFIKDIKAQAADASDWDNYDDGNSW
ncbi:MAG: VWA domain-containing protein [Deferribacterales bacterium]|nr:VWA domain-containing protein [Deferribacterales bacterium]